MLPTPITVREGRGHSSALSAQSLEVPGHWNEAQVLTKSSEFLLPAGTSWVKRDVLGVAEEVERMTGGRCRVASCSCGKCLQVGHFPHVVVELTRSGQTVPVFGTRELGPHVVQRLREIHVSNNPNKKSMKKNAEIRAAMKKKSREVQLERLDIIESALRSHKFDYRGPNGLRTRA